MTLPDFNPHTVWAAHTRLGREPIVEGVSLVVNPRPDTWLFLFPLMGTSWEQPADRGSDQGCSHVGTERRESWHL